MSNITQFTTGGVKSIQFGVYTTASPGYGNNVVNISTVNPAKVVVLVQGALVYGGYGYVPYPTVITATSITFIGPSYYSTPWNGTTASWQVIEYY